MRSAIELTSRRLRRLDPHDFEDFRNGVLTQLKRRDEGKTNLAFLLLEPFDELLVELLGVSGHVGPLELLGHLELDLLCLQRPDNAATIMRARENSRLILKLLLRPRGDRWDKGDNRASGPKLRK